MTNTSILWRDLDLGCDAEADSIADALKRFAGWDEGVTRSLRVALSTRVLQVLACQNFQHLQDVSKSIQNGMMRM